MTSDVHLDNVKVAAVVASVRVITTKKTGAEMAFAKLDDGTGNIEVVIFPRIFNETRDFWNEGRPLLISGKVDIRDETPGIIVEAIETINSLGDKKQKEVFINISSKTDPNSLQRLKVYLTENLGDHDAYLVFENGKKVKLPFRIYWDEAVAQKISDILESEVS